jgi:hypothetical protein
MNTTRKMIVAPVPSPSVQGRDTHRFTYRDKDGKTIKGPIMNKRKAIGASGHSATDTLRFSISGGRVKAGMSEKMPNPWYVGEYTSKTKEVDTRRKVTEIMSAYGLSGEEWDKELSLIIYQEEITTQRYLEILGGFAKDYYTELCPPKKGYFWSEEDLTPLMQFSYVFYDRENVIEDDTPKQRLAQQLVRMKTDKIAPNKNMINTATHMYYIAEENEQAKESKRKNDYENQAIVALVTLKNNYPLDANIAEWPLYQVSTMLTHNNKPLVKGAMPPVTVEQKLNSYIKDKQFGGINACKDFLAKVQLFEKNKERFYIEYLVQQAVNTNVIGMNNGFVFWFDQKSKKEEWYKFNSLEDFATFLQTEYDKHDPDQNLGTAYEEFLEQLKERQAII